MSDKAHYLSLVPAGPGADASHVLPTLEASRARLDSKERWISGTGACDKHGEPCHPQSAEAVQWCALGALLADAPNDNAYIEAYGALADVTGRGVIATNDRGSHGAVLLMYDAAIHRVREHGLNWVVRDRLT